MNAEISADKNADWLFILLGFKKRIRDAGIDTFPKLYRQGPNVILCAYGYMTPRRKLIWLRFCKFFIKALTVITILTIPIALFTKDMANDLMSLVPILAIGTIISWVLLCTGLNKYIGQFLLGKKTVIEFNEKKIKVYRHGYGLSFPISIKRDISSEISADTDLHERSSRVQKTNEVDPAFEAYSDAYRVKLIHGSRVVRVASVCGEFDARRMAEGIKKADELRQSLVTERIQEKTEEHDLPE
ncbi:MAG: hypothetical protein ACSHX0_13280 [Akkermansiaceae bacterium]